MSMRKFVETAAAGLMKVKATIKRKEMVAKLPTKVKKDVLAKLAAKGKVLDGTNMSFNLFGPHQEDFKLNVLRPANKLRTYLYENTLPMAGTDERLIPVARIPEFLEEVAKLIKGAEEGLDRFMPYYAVYSEEGRKAADHNIQASGVKASSYMQYPSPEEFRAAFAIEISPPMPLPVVDLERFGSLPADMAGRIAEANADMLARQLEAAKAAALKEALTQMETVHTQLTKGERLRPSLIENSKRVARLLRDMTENYDRDVRLLEVADQIEKEIGSIASTDMWKDNPTARKSSASVAYKATKTIKAVQKETAAAEKAAVKKSGGTTVIGGLLGDMM